MKLRPNTLSGRCLSLALLLLTVPYGLTAMPDSRSIFTHLSLEEGLSQVSVLSIAQDGEGYIWIATFDGLDRFDGYDIKVYRNKDNDPGSLPSNVIRGLFVDAKDNLWVGTTEGLCRYDRESDSFERLIEKNNRTYRFCNVADKGMLVHMSKETFLLDYSSGAVLRDCRKLLEKDPEIMAEDGDSIYCCARDSVFRYDVGVDKISLVSVLPANPSNIIIGKDGKLWLSSEGYGLFRVDPVSGASTNFISREGGLCSNFIRTLCFDDDGFLWLGTGNNLSIMDVSAETFTTISPDHENPHSLSHSSVRSIFKDSEGGMWLGTYFGGVNYYHRNRDVFRTFKFPSRESGIIGCIGHDPGGKIWVGTTRGNVSCLSAGSKDGFDVRLSRLGLSLDAEKNDIKVLHFTDERNMLVGTEFGGLYLYDTVSGKVTGLSGRGCPMSVHSIFPEGRFLLIGSMKGLFWMYYDLSESGEIGNEELANANGIYEIFKDSAGNLWLGTGNGVLGGSVREGTDRKLEMEISKSFRIGRVEDIFESSDGVLWFAGSGGLYSYDAGKDASPGKIENASFSSGFIHGMEQDSSGRLWLSTEKGLSSYQPGNGQVRNYYKEDGLPGNVFTIHSHTKTLDGTMYFGGLLGIISFKPDDMPVDTHSASPSFSDLYVLGKNIVPGDDSGILKKELRNTDRIDLNHRQNDFSIKFTAKNYSSWKGSRFLYCLSGVDKDWLPAGPDRIVRYSDIPKGKHILRVKSSNADGVWCENPAELLIVIHPVWYNTLFARIFELLLLLSVLGLGLRALVKYIYKENEKRMEMLRASKDDRIRELKMLSFVGLVGHSLPEEDKSFLSQVYEVVEEHYEDPSFSVDVLANEMNMARSTLYVKLKSLADITPTDFIKKMRLDRACGLLSESKLSVSEIAYKVGFASPAYFATDFKKYSGLSPKEYRIKRN